MRYPQQWQAGNGGNFTATLAPLPGPGGAIAFGPHAQTLDRLGAPDRIAVRPRRRVGSTHEERWGLPVCLNSGVATGTELNLTLCVSGSCEPWRRIEYRCSKPSLKAARDTSNREHSQFSYAVSHDMYAGASPKRTRVWRHGSGFTKSLNIGITLGHTWQ